MISELLGLVAFVVVVIALVRAFYDRAGERARPGRSPRSAIPVEDYGDIDATTRREMCPCGGRFVLRSEGPLTRGGRPLRVAQLECRRCARERRLYFDLSAMRH